MAKVPKRVAHLSSAHPADDIRIFSKECRCLAGAGYEVYLVARSERDYSSDGVRIIGVPTHKTRLGRMIGGVAFVFFKALKLKADLYHFHDPELIPAGLLLRLLGKKVIYDAHEDVAASLRSRYYLPKFSRNLLASIIGPFERLASRFFTKIVTATPAIAEHFDQAKTVCIANYVAFQNQSQSDTADRKKSNFIFAGHLSEIRGAEQMAQAVNLCKNPATRLDIIGRISRPSVRQEMIEIDKKNRLNFIEWMPKDQLDAKLRESFAGLVVFLPEPNHIRSQPNKIFEYMAAGIPVVISHFSDWKRIIDTFNCGLCVDPLDPRDIAEKLDWLLANPEEAKAMGERGKKAAFENFNWTVEAQRLCKIYEEIFSLQRG